MHEPIGPDAERAHLHTFEVRVLRDRSRRHHGAPLVGALVAEMHYAVRCIRLSPQLLDAHELIDVLVELDVRERKERYRPKVLAYRHNATVVDGRRDREVRHAGADSAEGLADAEQDLGIEVRKLNAASGHPVDALDEELRRAILRLDADTRPVALQLELPGFVLRPGDRRKAQGGGTGACDHACGLQVVAPVQRLLRVGRFGTGRCARGVSRRGYVVAVCIRHGIPPGEFL